MSLSPILLELKPWHNLYMGVSKNRGGPPKWMVFIINGKPYVLMDDLGGKPTIFGHIHMVKPFHLSIYQC